MVEMNLVNERSRIYHYPGGLTLRFDDVVKVGIGKTTHRIETALPHNPDEEMEPRTKKWIVAPGWVAIELDTDEWSF